MVGGRVAPGARPASAAAHVRRRRLRVRADVHDTTVHNTPTQEKAGTSLTHSDVQDTTVHNTPTQEKAGTWHSLTGLT